MNNVKRLVQVIFILVMLGACAVISGFNIANADDGVTEYWPQKVTVTSIDTVILFSSRNVPERAWIVFGIGSVTDTDNCDAGTHMFNLNFEMYPEIYVDEIALINGSCADDEIDVYEAVNWHLVEQLSYALEPMLQNGVMPDFAFEIDGVVWNEMSLWQAVHHHADEFRSHMIWNGIQWRYWEHIYETYTPMMVAQ
jgi:hypothetical protein